MMVMVSNRTDAHVLGLCRRFPGQVGCLMSPHGAVIPHPEIPFAIDNGAFSQNGDGFKESEWINLLNRTAKRKAAPIWISVPDFVGSRNETLRRWDKYYPVAAAYGWPLAFVVQDGMRIGDVPSEASVVFIGGSTKWKRSTARMWCESFPHVHIGRVWVRWLAISQRLGAESCDGTGWFRKTVKGRPARQLEAWLENPEPHPELNLV